MSTLYDEAGIDWDNPGVGYTGEIPAPRLPLGVNLSARVTPAHTVGARLVLGVVGRAAVTLTPGGTRGRVEPSVRRGVSTSTILRG